MPHKPHKYGQQHVTGKRFYQTCQTAADRSIAPLFHIASLFP